MYSTSDCGVNINTTELCSNKREDTEIVQPSTEIKVKLFIKEQP